MRILLYRHPDQWDRRELIPDMPPEPGELMDEPDEADRAPPQSESPQ